MEKWLPIIGFDGEYLCSNLGNFKSVGKVEFGNRRICKRKERFLKTSKDSSGYLQIGLSKNGKQTRYLAHRLIAQTFLGLDSERKFVNHKNGIKDDNRIENLEWVNRSENAKHSFRIGLQSNKGEKHPSAKLSWDIVNEIRKKYVPRKYSTYKLAKEYGVSATNIKDIVNNKIW